jgi:hypothetical protein
LILEHTFADDELTAPLRIAPIARKAPIHSLTLDDLGELMGCVAAEANHAKDQELQKELDLLFARMETVLDSYTDEHDGLADRIRVPSSPVPHRFPENSLSSGSARTPAREGLTTSTFRPNVEIETGGSRRYAVYSCGSPFVGPA